MGKKIRITIIVVIGLFLLSMLFRFPNYVRYEFEKKFGEPSTFFYGVGIGVMKTGDQNFYDDEYNLDDDTTIDLKPSDSGAFYIYGRAVNTFDPFVVVLNDKVIYNGSMQTYENPSFWQHIYSLKNFVVKLDGIQKGTINKLIISSGNYNKKYDLLY